MSLLDILFQRHPIPYDRAMEVYRYLLEEKGASHLSENLRREIREGYITKLKITQHHLEDSKIVDHEDSNPPLNKCLYIMDNDHYRLKFSFAITPISDNCFIYFKEFTPK